MKIDNLEIDQPFSLPKKNVDEKEKTDRCEWCGMEYPYGGYDYYEVRIFSTNHKICADCYVQLKKIGYEP